MLADRKTEPSESIRRDAWRAQLLREQVAEEMAARRHAAALRTAVFAGVAIGVIGSLFI